MGRFAPTGIRPRILERLGELGLPVPAELEAVFPEPMRGMQ